MCTCDLSWLKIWTDAKHIINAFYHNFIVIIFDVLFDLPWINLCTCIWLNEEMWIKRYELKQKIYAHVYKHMYFSIS